MAGIKGTRLVSLGRGVVDPPSHWTKLCQVHIWANTTSKFISKFKILRGQF